MNFMSGFFLKKYNQDNSSVVNNMQYNLFTIFPLSGPFAGFGFVFIDFITYFRLSVILTKYHYIILTDYPGIQFQIYFLNYINSNQYLPVHAFWLFIALSVSGKLRKRSGLIIRCVNDDFTNRHSNYFH